MSLTHDPSAIRYTTTQSAYGQTWTYHSMEDSGCQIWRNSAGQTALVPRIEPVVVKGPSPDWSFGDVVDSLVTAAKLTNNVSAKRPIYTSESPKYLEWIFDGKDDEVFIPNAYFKSVKRNPISNTSRAIAPVTVTNYGQLDAEIGHRLMEKGFFDNFFDGSVKIDPGF